MGCRQNSVAGTRQGSDGVNLEASQTFPRDRPRCTSPHTSFDDNPTTDTPYSLPVAREILILSDQATTLQPTTATMASLGIPNRGKKPGGAVTKAVILVGGPSRGTR